MIYRPNNQNRCQYNGDDDEAQRMGWVHLRIMDALNLSA